MKNKGFSYVEMIVVIAVMTILASFATLSISMVNRNNVNKACDKAISFINEARSSSITNGTDSGYVIFYSSDNGLFCYVGEALTSINISDSNQHWEKICSSGVDFYNGASKLDEGDSVSLQFKQSTGGLVVSTDSPILMFKKDTKQSSFQVDGVTGKVKHL